MRIVVTGAQGKIGRPTADYAHQQGADVLSVDSKGREGRGWSSYRHLTADLTDIGHVYEPLDGADAVINLAAIPTQRMFPSAQTFATNVRISFNVLEAAARMGVKRVVMISSIQVNRSATPRSPIRFQYLPLDEDHPPDPQDEYGLSKLTGEICAETFARHWGLTIVTLRPMWVCTSEEMARLPRPPDRADVYAYIHVEDMARICYLAATVDLPEASHTVLFATASDSSLDVPSLDYVKQTFPEAEIRPGLEGYNSLVSGKKAKEVLGFEPEISWRK